MNTGCYTALITPFKRDAVDEEGLNRLLKLKRALPLHIIIWQLHIWRKNIMKWPCTIVIKLLNSVTMLHRKYLKRPKSTGKSKESTPKDIALIYPLKGL